MTLTKRIDHVEQNLTPRQAISLWMKEAHRFPSLLEYYRWLLGQPEDANPLVRLPAQVARAVTERSRGMAKGAEYEQLYRAERDLLFLYFLHELPNVRLAESSVAVGLRLVWLTDQLRTILKEQAVLSRLYFERLRLLDEDGKGLKSIEQTLVDDYLDRVRKWPEEAVLVAVEVKQFSAAVVALSRRYFGGEDILYADAREAIDSWRTGLADLKEIYTDCVTYAGEASGFYLPQECYMDGTETLKTIEDAREAMIESGAESLARELIIYAKAAALENLGQAEAANTLEEQLVIAAS